MLSLELLLALPQRIFSSTEVIAAGWHVYKGTACVAQPVSFWVFCSVPFRTQYNKHIT